MSKPTFLTGASGFIGTAVARLLIKKGHRLRVLSRPNNDRRNLHGLDVEIIECDLTKPETYSKALKGCGNLFHVAADYRLWVPDANNMHRVNLHGTRALMQAALDMGIERIVYTSSVATMGLNNNGMAADEHTPASFRDMVGVYKQSKYLAEREVQRMIKHDRLPVIIVNPTTPLGPRDIKPTPTGRIIFDAIKGRMPAYPIFNKPPLNSAQTRHSSRCKSLIFLYGGLLFVLLSFCSAIILLTAYCIFLRAALFSHDVYSSHTNQ